MDKITFTDEEIKSLKYGNCLILYTLGVANSITYSCDHLSRYSTDSIFAKLKAIIKEKKLQPGIYHINDIFYMHLSKNYSWIEIVRKNSIYDDRTINR